MENLTKRKRKTWTRKVYKPHEDEVIIKAISACKKKDLIPTKNNLCKELGVEFSSLADRIRRLQLDGRLKKFKRQWTKEDDQYIIDNRKYGNQNLLAIHFGVSVIAIIKRCETLKITSGGVGRPRKPFKKPKPTAAPKVFLKERKRKVNDVREFKVQDFSGHTYVKIDSKTHILVKNVSDTDKEVEKYTNNRNNRNNHNRAPMNPTVSIHKNKYGYQAFFNSDSLDLIVFKEMNLDIDEMKITRPSFDATKKRKVHLVAYGANLYISAKDRDDIVGRYKVEKENEDIFYLEKIA